MGGKGPERRCGGGTGFPKQDVCSRPWLQLGMQSPEGLAGRLKTPPMVIPLLICAMGSDSQSWEQLLASQVQNHHQEFIRLPLCAKGVPKRWDQS